MLALSSVTALRVVSLGFALLIPKVVASGFGGAGFFQTQLRVTVALIRVTVGSALLGSGFDVLIVFQYHFIYYLALIYLQYAPLVVAHDRPSRVVVSTSTGGPSSPCPNWPVERP